MSQHSARDQAPNHSSGKPHRFQHRRWLLWGGPAALAGAFFLHYASRVQAFGGGRHGHWGHGEISDQQIERMFAKRLDTALDVVDASDAQRAQVQAVANRVLPELKALRSEKKKLHDAFTQALSADAIDAGRIEQLRREANTLVDRASAIGARTLTETAQILTPAQRRKLVKLVHKHRG